MAVVAVIACSAFAARAVAAFVDADYLADSPHPAVAPAAPPAAKKSAPRKLDPNTLVDRNIFCSICVRELSGPRSTDASYSGQPAVLIATSIGMVSTATVRVTSTEVQGGWMLGDTIPGVGRIEAINPTWIDVVDAHDYHARLSLLGAATPQPEHAPTSSPGSPFADRVKKISDSEYEVDRSLVRDLVSGAANPNGARAVPVFEKGEVHGIRLSNVRPGSVAAEFGLKSGDVIAAIDNDPIKNVQQLLDLYAKLDQLSGVKLDGTRANKPFVLTLRLR